MGSLNLPTSYRTAVWRVVKAAIEADTAYDEAGIRLVWPDGDPEQLADLDTYAGPVLSFFPSAGQMAWFDEGSASGALVVTVEARLARLDVEDVFDLQEVLETTLNTITDPGSLRTDLVQAGAVTGLILFQQPLRPAPGKPGADNLFRLSGQFVVEVLRPLT